jgi:hypothetical protein
MKNFKTIKPYLVGILMLFILAMLPGYSPEPDEQFCPAPFEKPAFALYHNFSSSGIYDPTPESDQALASLTFEIDAFMPLDHSWMSTTRQCRIDYLKNFLVGDEFRPAELFFYFENPEKFALMIFGTYNPQKLAQILSADKSNNENHDFVRLFSFAGRRFHLGFSAEQIILMPEGSVEEALNRLKNPDATLNKKFSAFLSMLKGKPALAAEIDFQTLSSSIASLSGRLPKNFTLLQHLRLIADDQLAKIQLYVPETENRNELTQKIDLSPLEKWLGAPGSVQLRESGKSLFIETEAGKGLEKTVSHKFAAMLMHFFLKHSFKCEVASLSQENHEQIE